MATTEGRKLNKSTRKAIDDLLNSLMAQHWDEGAATLYVRMVALDQIDRWRECRTTSPNANKG